MKVILLDDHADTMEEAIMSIRDSGVQCEPLRNISELENLLNKGEPFDGVILDWFLDDEPDSNLAKISLQKIREHRFVPVFVYTEHRTEYEREADSIDFPRSCISSFSKTALPESNLGAKIKEWLDGFFAGKISRSWRKANQGAIEKVLYELASMDDDGIVGSLQRMIQSENGEAYDVDHALELLHRISVRVLSNDAKLRSILESCLKSKTNNEKAAEMKIWQFHMYYQPGGDIVRAGDIVQSKRDSHEEMEYFVILTPACDLAQFKTTYLRLVRMIPHNFADGEPPRHLYFLPFVPLDATKIAGFAIDFHQSFAVRNESIEQEWQKLQKEKGQKKLPKINMAYSHKYQEMSGEGIVLKRIARLDDPYRSDLFQKFSSHASRIGVPDVSS